MSVRTKTRLKFASKQLSLKIVKLGEFWRVWENLPSMLIQIILSTEQFIAEITAEHFLPCVA
jgi:hypothetical protein